MKTELEFMKSTQYFDLSTVLGYSTHLWLKHMANLQEGSNNKKNMYIITKFLKVPTNSTIHTIWWFYEGVSFLISLVLALTYTMLVFSL